MPFPGVRAFTLTHLIRGAKLLRTFFGVLIHLAHVVAKLHEMSPDCAIAIERSSAVVKPLQFAHGTSDELLQRQVACNLLG